MLADKKRFRISWLVDGDIVIFKKLVSKLDNSYSGEYNRVLVKIFKAVILAMWRTKHG